MMRSGFHRAAALLLISGAAAGADAQPPPTPASGADTVYVAPPTGETERDRARIVAALDAIGRAVEAAEYWTRAAEIAEKAGHPALDHFRTQAKRGGGFRPLPNPP